MREVAVATVGFFDGVHLGHRHVIQSVVSSARERGEEAIAFSFWPHPRMVLQQDARELRLLSSLEEKRSMLLSLGLDRVEVLPFSRELAAMTACEFISMLRDSFALSHLVMGYDNRIGSDLRTFSELSVPGVSMSCAGEFSGGMSSTMIRKVLSEGKIEEANSMLGYSYGLGGVVVPGNRMGRTIGFPTANMQLYEPLKLVPGGGVYVVDVEIMGRKFRGMCNIGTRPTVGGLVRTIETNIFDFSEDIYGLPLELRLRKRLRSEVRFPSLEALKTQLEKDRETAKASFGDRL